MVRAPVFARANLRFVLALAVIAGLLLLDSREEMLGPVLLPLRTLTAKTALALIQWLGMEAVRQACAIYHPGGFAYEISRGCIGLVPIAFLVVSVLAYPGNQRSRLAGLALGVLFLVVLNLIRLVHLFYLGVHQPQLFELAHKVLWQAVIVLAVFALWIVCTTRLDLRGTPAQRSRAVRPRGQQHLHTGEGSGGRERALEAASYLEAGG